ncbi:TrkH family potassium uptake protein [Desulfolucanica intricata]|uniref:TrkH family potassium uptake protein n=1 Tax=Desulfolucanica intricata TaxID=1285191 RepID=UPI00082FADDB|nr:TrkH family potassium uptake protein [Desulfolucanica intricata]
MNTRIIIRVVGFVLLFITTAMLPSLIMSLYYGEGYKAFLYSIIITGLLGAAAFLVPVKSKEIGYREGFLIANIVWVLAVIVGSLPFIISEVLTPVDALFESTSGFTTTGASVIADVESLPRGLSFWRSMMHWVGGMGILVLVIALIPSFRLAGMQLLKVELTGPTKSKIMPRVIQTIRELYKIYILLTVLAVIALKIAGLTWYDSFYHAFSVVATGGYSSKNAGVGAFNSFAVEMILVVFMLIASINFTLLFILKRGKIISVLKDSEVKAFLAIVTVAFSLIGYDLYFSHGESSFESFRYSIFQTASLITGTGFATADYNVWPPFSQAILLNLMLIGGCAGSTCGGIKVIRFLILFNNIKKYFLRIIHPEVVTAVRVGKRIFPEDVVQGVQVFFFFYLSILGTATLVISSLGVDFITSLTAVAASLGNVGPGLELVGPSGNYSLIPPPGKIILSLCMVVGRLEIFTVLVLFSYRFWK